MRLWKRFKINKAKIRKLTDREKILINTFIFILLYWLIFKFFINPQIYKITSLEKQIDDYIYKIENNNKTVKDEKIILEEKNNLNLEKEKIGVGFFAKLNQSEIIYILNDLFLKNDLEIESMNFSKPINETLFGIETSKLEISIPFKGELKSLIEIVELIEREHKKIFISKIDLEKNEESNITGSINLEVYSLNNILEVKQEKPNIQVTQDNKSNPFTPYKGYASSNILIKKEIKESVDKSEIEELEELEDNSSFKEGKYEIYKAVKGDNISYICMRKYGTEKYVDEILKFNGMVRSSILPVGKEIKLIKK